MKLQIEYLPIEQITPYENNARKHQTEDVDAIVESIKEFDFDDPIGVWGEKNVIVEGHGRLLAAKKLGIKKDPRYADVIIDRWEEFTGEKAVLIEG